MDLPPLAPTARPRSAFVAVVLGWLLPGLGQLYVGRPVRALVMGSTISLLFVGGLWLSAYSCVNPNTYELEFVAHALIGGPTALVLHFAPTELPSVLLPHLEVGRLYCAVAGLLNLVAICDALGEVLEQREELAARDELTALGLEVPHALGLEVPQAPSREVPQALGLSGGAPATLPLPFPLDSARGASTAPDPTTPDPTTPDPTTPDPTTPDPTAQDSAALEPLS